MAKVVITCEVPTSYQHGSLSFFNLRNETKNPNGSYSAWEVFDTVEEAKKHLINRVKNSDSFTPQEEKEAIANIKKNKMLRYDAATATIVKQTEYPL